MTERDLFLAALDLPDPAARAHFLADKCGPDIELRRKVEGLLAVHVAAGDFLSASARDPDATLSPKVDPSDETGTLPPVSTGTLAHAASPDAALGSIRYFGDYELLGEIARGGIPQ